MLKAATLAAILLIGLAQTGSARACGAAWRDRTAAATAPDKAGGP